MNDFREWLETRITTISSELERLEDNDRNILRINSLRDRMGDLRDALCIHMEFEAELTSSDPKIEKLKKQGFDPR